MMKKYWSLIIIVTVIVATLATHYIQMASASNNEYQVTFEKIRVMSVMSIIL